MPTASQDRASNTDSQTLATHASGGRRLNLFSLTLFGLGNMLGAGIYATVGVAAREMGNALWVAFVASMVAAGLTGLSYACLGSRYPHASGAAFITQRAYRKPFISYFVGLTVVCSGLTSMATATHAFAQYGMKVIPWLDKDVVGNPWAVRGVGLLFLLGIGLVTFRGMKESTWLNALCTAVETLGLLLVIAVGLPWIFKSWGTVNYLDATTVANPDGMLTPALVLSGAVLTFYSFMGFEDLLHASEEVKNPRKTLPRAMMIALGVTAAVYLLVSFAAVSVLPAKELGASKEPALYLVVKKAAPWFRAEVFSLIAAFAVMNTTLINCVMGSRLVYGMARQGLVPRKLGALHAGRGTPHMAIIGMLSVALGLVAIGAIKSLAEATSLLLLGAYSAVNVALVVLKLRKGEARGEFEVPVFVPVLGAGLCAAMIGTKVWKLVERYAVMRSKSETAGAAFEECLMPLVFVAGVGVLIVVLYLTLRPKVVDEEIPTGDGVGAKVNW